MPQKDDHPKFHEWAQQYGPIYSLITGAKTTIVLSSDTAIKDLLDKRSDIYSDRLDLYLGQTLCSGGLRVLMMVTFPQSMQSNDSNVARTMVRRGAWYVRFAASICIVVMLTGNACS